MGKIARSLVDLFFREAIAVCGGWIGDRCLIYFLRGDSWLFKFLKGRSLFMWDG
ncbi:MAG: hypothetical protein IM537_16115 [Pseudanabaena sp. M57BS1SP1A06MG]|nr:hypothetical protein [Pseudanabaena sp. M53BS1SP1A06MG]MCA6581909.1 hypothetical protein [Pseudanabaena sp. M34BS1SP1A06MG]MCA6593268.1 hypothetical protein [Pseudanabaena sp. M38BS1SP1A06MG]MCA6601681.1 hypothetical protein [Pseudanabaena sp. M57BS1SP1A06MG]